MSFLALVPRRCSTVSLGKLVQQDKKITSIVNAKRSPNLKFARSFTTASTDPFVPLDTFVRRHNGPRDHEVQTMLKTVGYDSLESFANAVVPKVIKASRPLAIRTDRGEKETLDEFKQIAAKNKLYRSFIGMGYYGTVTPPVILRNVLENPGWYTPYTPYQAEISQGRLESLLNYQTMITQMTGMDISNASLLDEATAAAEAMTMCFSLYKKKKNVFFVSQDCHPQNIELIKTRAEPLGVKVVVGDWKSFDFSKGDACGVILQYPATDGTIADLTSFVEKVHNSDALVVCATDLLSLALLKPPGEFGCDIVLGSAQRFGVPMGYGGPHAAFFATNDKYKRIMPGRLIGVSKDSNGDQAYRMALQTREQHIRRETATSNICTAQALLANMAAMYAVYHGPKGVKAIAQRVQSNTAILANGLQRLGFKVVNPIFFDTIRVDLGNKKSVDASKSLLKRGINVRVFNETTVTISLDETVTEKDLSVLFEGFAEVSGTKLNFTPASIAPGSQVPSLGSLARTTPYLTHPVFNKHHSETEMLRYLKLLENKDLSLANCMIPLGSCTMKLNATSEMIPVTWPELTELHPFVPIDQAQGYMEIFDYLSKSLCEITRFHAISLQPNAGSQGEYAGLKVIRAYLKDIGQGHRDICLIPTSAHGTNPASAAMVGMKIVTIKADKHGNVDVADLTEKAEQYKENLAALMITYPSTHGVFEEPIKDICATIHKNGGQVYMDGANMNSQVGLCSPGEIGADVCHLNLHKTFCIPHGGGGPGMGPIGVAKHLAPYLPTHPVVNMGKFGGAPGKGIGPVSGAPFGSSSILPISYMYIQLMGGAGLTQATQVAMLSANYMAARLKNHYKIVYKGSKGLVAHEFIVDFREFKETANVEVEDVAKRLIDYGFHAPTMSFPLPGSLMIEPTESEPKEELDRLCDALISIRNEIKEIEDGKADKQNNVLKHAPHTAKVLLSDKWNRPYSREKAAYPVDSLRKNKYFPSVGRIDSVYGDRNLFCSCPPVETLN